VKAIGFIDKEMQLRKDIGFEFGNDNIFRQEIISKSRIASEQPRLIYKMKTFIARYREGSLYFKENSRHSKTTPGYCFIRRLVTL
jgi:hypothetical protein